jgi:ABC-type dipeptide/oligopeptide/nickel transport system ATPase component
MDIVQLLGLKNNSNEDGILNNVLTDNKEAYRRDYNNFLSRFVNSKKIDTIEYARMLQFFEEGGVLSSMSFYTKIIDKVDDNGFEDLCMKIFIHLYEIQNPNKTSKIISDMLKHSDTVSELTKDQTEAASKILDFLQDDSVKTYGLYGYSGTGKSTLVTKLIHLLVSKNYVRSVVLAAPTNKAVNVLKSKFKEDVANLITEKTNIINGGVSMTFEEQLEALGVRGINIQFMTVHKLLDYKNEFSVSGERIFVKGKKSTLTKYDIVVLDECSMIPMQISNDIFEDIRFNTRSKIPKVLFVGDNAQLPPVNETTSIIFSQDPADFELESFKKVISFEESFFGSNKDSDTKYVDLLENLKTDILKQKSTVLKEVVRSDNDKVVGLCNDVRAWVTGLVKEPRISGFKGEKVKIYKLKQGKDKLKSKWFKACIKNFTEANSCQHQQTGSNILLTWTNKQTDLYNKTVRKKLFDGKKSKLDTFEVGDILVLNDFYNVPTDSSQFKKKEKGVRLYTSEQIKVIDTEHITKVVPVFSEVLPERLKTLKYFVGIDSAFKKTVRSINKTVCRTYDVWRLTVENLAESCKKDSIAESFTMYVIKDKSAPTLEDDKIISSTKIRDLRKYCNGMFKDNIITIDREIIKTMWSDWSKRFCDPFANVKYGASMSTHKSQGSSFYNVFVDVDDILKNRNENDAKRCLYTAITRTSNELHILI